ncbi:MAG: glycosyltransferase involved in cell wall biosynthesis [Saprospiraceae bacterium]|jgi:glycosyltransferase involved in cell wall biosynthesis
MIITIITATYNSGKTIRDTIESVKSQNYSNIEHIIVDGASKDNTLAIVKEYDHIQKIISEPDKGIYDAMNKGISMATGDIVGILNSDDYYTDNSIITKVVSAFKTNDTDSVYGDLQYVDKDNTDKIIRNWVSGEFKSSNLTKGWMPPHPTFFVKKGVYEKSGKFNLDFKIGADVEFILRTLGKDKISTNYIPEVLVKMRTGGESNRSLKNRMQLLKEYHKAYKLNKLEYKFYTIPYRLLSKIPQFFKK